MVDKKDVFVNLPTRFGKSLIYQALSFVFDDVNRSAGHIVVVVSPLVSLIDDQVKILTDLKIDGFLVEHNSATSLLTTFNTFNTICFRTEWQFITAAAI